MKDTSDISETDGPTRVLERRRFRYRRIRRAVLISILSKIAGLGVYGISYPLAARTLGPERFGIYTMLLAIVAWLDLGSVGVGPGLTQRLAVAWNKGNLTQETEYFSAALLLMIVFCFIVLVISSVFIILSNIFDFSISILLGAAATDYRSDISQSLELSVVLFLIYLIFSVGDRARSAYQEDYITNVFSLCGNILSIGAVFFVSSFHPSIEGFVAATFGVTAFTKAINTFLLIAVSRRYLLRWSLRINRQIINDLLGTGAPFWVIQLSTLATLNGTIILVGWITTPVLLAPFALLYRILQILANIVTMFTQSVWPAITDAHVRGDHSWIQRTYKMSSISITAYSTATAVVLWIAGPRLIQLWIGEKIVVPPQLIDVMSVYFVIWMWNHFHTAVLLGLGWLWIAALLLSIDAVGVLSIGIILTTHLGPIGMAIGLCAGFSIVSSWLAPLLMWAGQYGRRSPLQGLALFGSE